jgi:hypothetical protein
MLGSRLKGPLAAGEANARRPLCGERAFGGPELPEYADTASESL